MDRHSGGSAMSTTTLHYQLGDVWRSPRGTVLRIEALALVAIALSFLVVAFGSCRRWSNSWFIQKGFLAAQVLSLSLGTYSIGLMQSSPVKSEMYPIWAVSLLTLFGCVDPITTYVGLDYKGPLSRMIFQFCLYCGYVLVMSVSTTFSVVGNVAICVLCVITFFKGFHRSLALVLPSKMQRYLGTSLSPETGALLAGHGQDLEVFVIPTPRDDNWDTTTMGDIHSSCTDTGEHELSSIIGTSSGSGRTSIEDVCFGYSLSRLLRRRFLGMDTASEMEAKRKIFQELIEGGKATIDYKWAFKVIEVEMAFLYEVFFTSNEFLHMHDANTASFWAFASFIGICFVGVVAAIPRAMASHHRRTASAHDAGTNVLVVDTTTADLTITVVILVSLALLQLMQLIRRWTSNWARVAFVEEYARYHSKMRSGHQRNDNALTRPAWYRRIRRWWKRMKVRLVTSRMDWFDNKYLWQNKLRQYSLVEACGVRRCIRTGRICFIIPFWLCSQLPGMLGSWYVGQVLGELLFRNSNAGAAVKLHDDVKASIAKFLGTIKSRRIGVQWSSLFLENGLRDWLEYFPYKKTSGDEPEAYAFTRRVMIWHIATWYCEEAEKATGGNRGGAGDGCSRSSGGSREKNQRVAMDLSKYCAYLVVSAPELLPGPPVEIKRAFEDAELWTKKALKGQRNMLEATAPFVSGERAAGSDAFDIGVHLGERLLDKTTTPTPTDHWELLARLWVQTLLYAAPNGDVQSHMQHLSQGGEFISHLWALLYHLGIDSWEKERNRRKRIDSWEKERSRRKRGRVVEV